MIEKPGNGTEGTEGRTTLAEEIRRGSGLPAVSRLFRELIKNPDKILIPNPRDRINRLQVGTLIIPKTLLRRLPEGIYTALISRGQTVTGTLVALFIPDSTPATEYRLYHRLTPEERTGLYIPQHGPLKTHEVIYDKQEPAVQQRLLITTVQAIYLKEKQEKQAAASKNPPWSKIFKP